jgi:hypothetical protein
MIKKPWTKEARAKESMKKTKDTNPNQKENDCNNLNWDVKACLKNENVIEQFKNCDEIVFLQNMKTLIGNQSNKDTYVNYQNNERNLSYLWANYEDQAKIYFVYNVLSIGNPNVGLAINSLKSDAGWSKNVKGMENTKRNWNFMNKLVWKDLDLDTFGSMYQTLIENEVDPWSKNTEEEDAYGSFICRVHKLNKIDDREFELFLLKMVETTSTVFVENKTQVILNKASYNYNIFESKLRYLYMSDTQSFHKILVNKLVSFKDMPRPCEKFNEVSKLFLIIRQTMDNTFLNKIPKVDFIDVCNHYKPIIDAKIKRQKIIMSSKFKAKNCKIPDKQIKLWDAHNVLINNKDTHELVWTDIIFHYYLNQNVDYITINNSTTILYEMIFDKIIDISKNYVKGESNPFTTSWSLESLVAFLAESLIFNLDLKQELVVNMVQKTITEFTNLDADIRFKIGMRFCVHWGNKNIQIVDSIKKLVTETTSTAFKFMLHDFLDQ